MCIRDSNHPVVSLGEGNMAHTLPPPLWHYYTRWDIYLYIVWLHNTATYINWKWTKIIHSPHDRNHNSNNKWKVIGACLGKLHTTSEIGISLYIYIYSTYIVPYNYMSVLVNVLQHAWTKQLQTELAETRHESMHVFFSLFSTAQKFFLSFSLLWPIILLWFMKRPPYICSSQTHTIAICKLSATKRDVLVKAML